MWIAPRRTAPKAGRSRRKSRSRRRLLIRPITGSHGTARVIGEARGKLNGLRLHGLKDPSQYKDEASARAKDQGAAGSARWASMTPKEREAERWASMTPKEREAENGKLTQAKADRQAAEERFTQSVLGTATGGQGGE